MRRGPQNKGWTGAASAVLAVLFLSSAADATPTLREVERRRASAEADRRRLETEARAAERELKTLAAARESAEAQRRAAATEVTTLERLATQLTAEERRAEERRARAGAALEATLITLSLPEPDAPQIVAAVAGRELARRATISAIVAGRAREERADLAARRAELAVAQARLDSAGAALEAALLQQQARRALLNAEAVSAGRRVTALAEQARSLRALVARATRPRSAVAATPQSASLKTRGAPSGAGLARLVAGSEIARRFGARGAEGVTLRTASGARVLAPSAAKVAWAGPFRSYGSVLILDPGGDVAIVLTGMGSVLVREGQIVQPGRAIAEMPLDATAAPELYVEVRRNGDPVDPVPWLNGRR